MPCHRVPPTACPCNEEICLGAANSALPTSTNTSGALESKNLTKRARQQANHREKCGRLLLSSAGAPATKLYVRQKHIQSATPIKAKIDIQKSNVVSTGYTGRDNGVRSTDEIFLEELLSEKYGGKFKLQEWDGRYGIYAASCLDILTHVCSHAIPIIDRMQCVIAILAGMPCDEGWRGLMQEAARILEDACQQSSLSPSAANHRRGDFFTLRSGISHGGGQTRPMNVSNNTQPVQLLEVFKVCL